MEIFIVLLILGVTVGILAEDKNHSFLLWAVYGFLLFPVALAHITISSDRNHVLCKFCLGYKVRAAKFCKCCGQEERPTNKVDKYISARLAGGRKKD